MDLGLVVIDLHTSLPIKVCTDVIIDAPRNQFLLRMRFGVIAHEQIVIVSVGAAIEADIRAIVTRAADGRVLVTKVTAVHVVVRRVNKAVLFPIERAAFVGKKENSARTGNQSLR